jgi:tripartite-type tricarboxylate transporter receptor subunit TctC
MQDIPVPNVQNTHWESYSLFRVLPRLMRPIFAMFGGLISYGPDLIAAPRRRYDMRASTIAIATLALSLGAQAQGTFPEKPVRIIVDSAPGSATDVSVRLMAERLSAIGGQQAVVDNRPGGGGAIAARAGQTATPDGYTLYVVAASTFVALKGAPGVAPNLPIELPRDFSAIGFITHQPMFIAVAPQIGVQSLPQLIALAKNQPRYSGLAGAMTSGLIKGIAVASLERLDDFKDLPTVAETLPGFVAGGWNVLLAPVGTPETMIQKTSVDLRKAMDDRK